MEAARADALESGRRFDSLEAFIADRGGRRVIRKILVANNGIAAVKCMVRT